MRRWWWWFAVAAAAVAATGCGADGGDRPPTPIGPPSPEVVTPPPAGGPGAALILDRYRDPSEGAFSVLVPSDWTARGGIARAAVGAPDTATTPATVTLDLALVSDDTGTVSVRWLPHIDYVEPSFDGDSDPGTPSGSAFTGPTSLPMMTAAEFAVEIVFPYLHGSVEARVVETLPFPEVARAHRRLLTRLGALLQPTAGDEVDAETAAVILEYDDRGSSFREFVAVTITSRGPAGARRWRNWPTLAVRAPVSQFDDWSPAFGVIVASLRPDPRWLETEIRDRAARGEISVSAGDEVASVARAATDHWREVMLSFAAGCGLQPTRTDPSVEKGSDGGASVSGPWSYRWEDETGGVIYSDDPDYDPNRDPNFGSREFRRFQSRP